MSTARLIPQLVCRDATDALAFYQRALGAEAVMVLHAPDGKLMHACLRVDGAELFVCDECPEHGAHAPQPFAGTPVTLHLAVDDCDAVFARAVEAGCQPRMPPQDMFWGDRYGVFVDPYGHSWSVATTLREMGREELERAVAQACAAPVDALSTNA